MTSPTPRLPKYRHYKPKNLAVVRIGGRDYYLGRFGSEESHEKYRRLLAEILFTPARTPAVPTSHAPDASLTVTQLMVLYWDRHVVPYYVKDGQPTSERDNIRQALRFLRGLHGHTAARDVGPVALKLTRQAMIEAGRCRSLINKDISRIRGMFRWAVEQELLPVTVHQALMSVAGLPRDRSAAKEWPPVGTVPEAHIEAVLPLVSPTVAAMIRVQRLTSMRPQEVILMRAIDIDRSDPDCWVYRPHRPKSQHRGRERMIPLGPRCREALGPFLGVAPEDYLFSPRRAEAQRRADLAAQRGRSASSSPRVHAKGSGPLRGPGELYDGGAYRKAIRRACLRLGLPVWFPHQLRHNAASAIRHAHGLEAAQAVLGHSELGTTQVYAEVDRTAARRVMAAMG